MFLLIFCTFSFEKYLVVPLPIYWLEYCSLVFEFFSSLSILETNPLLTEELAQIFCNSLGYLFTLIIVFLAMQ
jgi:hypothetical protein